MYKYKEPFDLSNFPVKSKYYCSDNKKVISKMKDEYRGKSILKFVGLKSKMYSILDESNNEKITIKGHNGFIFRNFTIHSPSIETHLPVVRGLPTKKFQTECVNEKSSTERRS